MEHPGLGDGPGKEDEIEATEGVDTGFDTAAAYAEAMQRWGDYGTGFDPYDDGFGWNTVSNAPSAARVVDVYWFRVSSGWKGSSGLNHVFVGQFS